MVGKHLSKAFEEKENVTEKAVKETFAKHILHFIEKGSGKNVCIGSDFDGTDSLCGFETADKMQKIADYMRENGAGNTLINDIFYNNAFNFFTNNL